MTTVDTPPAPDAAEGETARTSPAILAVGSAVAAAAALGLPEAGWARAVVAGVAMVTLVATLLVDRALALLATTAYLATLGLLRRLVSMVQADPNNDPLLLVVPVVATAFALLALRDGALRRRTALTIGVGVFFVMSVVAIANPTVALVSNIKGALFWSVPLLWFPVGRTLAEPLVRRVLQLVAVLGIGACATGVVQATVGFPPWDERWIDARGYIALGVSGQDTLRPFGWSASAGEFALTAAIVALLCSVLLVAAIRDRAVRRIGLYGVGVGVASAALILSAVRTAVLLGLVAAVVVVVAQRRASLARVGLGLAVGFAVLVAGVRLLDVESWYDHGITGLLRRSLVGLAHPFDPDESTLAGHIELTDTALRTLDERPLGGGPAFGTTPAPEGREQQGDVGGIGDRTDQADSVIEGELRSAENDLGNALLAFGVLGGVLVLVITVLGLRTAWQNVRRHPGVVALCALGVLVASLRFWWTGAHYAPAMLVWLLLGWSDRQEQPES